MVIQPKDADEVACAVKYAVSHSIPLTACCGGHSSSGTSSTEGMLIDLRLMRQIDVDQTNMTISFGGGCIWQDIDSTLNPMKLATVGGVVNHTGTSGLILGGGHGYLTAKHGLTIDCILSAEVVLADGSIVQTSSSSNPDLFWALRGAGAQFGIVTRFVSRVFPQDEVWSGTLAYALDKLPGLVEIANEFHDRQNRDGHCLAIGIGFTPDGATRGLSAIPLYHGSLEDGRAYFSKLFEIGPVADNTMAMTMGSVNTLLNPIFDHGSRRLMGSGNAVMPLKADDLQRIADEFWEFCEKHQVGAKSVIALELFSTHMIEKVAQTATAYANRGNYYDAVTAFGWTDPSLDGTIREFNRHICKQIRQTIGYTFGGDGAVGRYINIEADRVSPQDAYGVNLGRLRELKARYDPGNVFNKWHGIHPADAGKSE